MSQTIEIGAGGEGAVALSTHQPRRARIFDRRMIAGLVIFLAVLVFFLSFTRLPAALGKFTTVQTAVTNERQNTFSQVIDPESVPIGLRWFAYGVNLWDGNAIGMFFAMLLAGAAITTFAYSPQAKLRKYLRMTGPRGAALGAGMGIPLFMCSACSAPVSMGFLRGGAAMETSLGVIFGSSLFHPIAITAIFVLFPLEMGIARVAFGLLLLLAAVPLIARLARHAKHGGRLQLGLEGAPALDLPILDMPAGADGDACVVDLGTAGDVSWPMAFWEALKAFGRNTVDFAFRLGPAMLLAGFAVGVVFSIVPPQRVPELIGAGVVAVIVAAAVGTLIQVPGMFEIPLVLGVVALGVGLGPATALLLTIPSAGLITLAVTRKDLGVRTPGLMLLSTFVLGSVAGLVVNAL